LYRFGSTPFAVQKSSEESSKRLKDSKNHRKKHWEKASTFQRCSNRKKVLKDEGKCQNLWLSLTLLADQGDHAVGLMHASKVKGGAGRAVARVSTSGGGKIHVHPLFDQDTRTIHGVARDGAVQQRVTLVVPAVQIPPEQTVLSEL
jgi:hypothetical protein